MTSAGMIWEKNLSLIYVILFDKNQFQMVIKVNVTNRHIRIRRWKYWLNVWNTMTFCIKEQPLKERIIRIIHCCYIKV